MSLLHILTPVLVLSAVIPVIVRKPGHSTLTQAWGCTVATAGCWLLAAVVCWIGATSANQAVIGWCEPLWYFATVMALCPPLAVLGARRPTVRVWPLFVLCPLIAVFAWPPLAIQLGGGGLRGVLLELPLLIGFAVVLTMGVGNYLGTGHGVAALLYAAGAALSALPLTEWDFARDTAERFRFAAAAAMVTAAWRVHRRVRQAERVDTGGFDRLWIDFRDQFGVVWARPVQDHVNHMLQKEHIAARLDWNGVNPPVEETSAAPERLDHHLRWALRRFVDDAWIAARRQLPAP